MYTLYKITNTVNNKSYIGVTTKSVEERWKCHINTAFKKKATYKFSHALRKYGTECWTKEILKTGISSEEVEQVEIDAISYYKTKTEGYNTSLGGKIPKGIITKKGKEHHSTDNTIYNFYNKDGRAATSTLQFFTQKEKIVKANAQSAFSRGQFIFGWTNSKEVLTKWENKLRKNNRAAKNPKAKKYTPKPKKQTLKKVYTLYSSYGIPFTGTLVWLVQITSLTKRTIFYILNTNTSYYSWRASLQAKQKHSFAKENNPMYGKSRPDYVKEAVRSRVRDSADPELRDWIHKETGKLELQIRTLDLRDKYNLNISHLKKITDNHIKYKTHKGWKLYETNI